MRTERAVSAGGVVFRERDRRIEIALCGRDADGLWALPKGGPNPGEDLEDTALREVREETGLEVRLIEKIGVVNYWFAVPSDNVQFHKFVHHYLMAATGGDVANHDCEHDRVEWFPLETALTVLTYQNDVGILEGAQALIEKGKGIG